MPKSPTSPDMWSVSAHEMLSHTSRWASALPDHRVPVPTCSRFCSLQGVPASRVSTAPVYATGVRSGCWGMSIENRVPYA
jgi:hypothetical protein